MTQFFNFISKTASYIFSSFLDEACQMLVLLLVMPAAITHPNCLFFLLAW